jgi:hypothetical protein
MGACEWQWQWLVAVKVGYSSLLTFVDTGRIVTKAASLTARWPLTAGR